MSALFETRIQFLSRLFYSLCYSGPPCPGTSAIYEGAILHVAGWTFRKSGKLEVRREGAAAVYGIPYSEHSNFSELRHCVAALRPKRIIPTVNVTDSTR